MAHLLGSRFCIESLASDVKDLQNAISDVFSRVGVVRFPSWKFPDKVSCDLNIAEMMKEYQYSETDDEESRQVSHIMLFELVIDRLVLLLQSFTRFAEQILSDSQGMVPSTKVVGSQMSIGLVTKKYWNKMVHLSTTCHQIISENKSSLKTIDRYKTTIEKLKDRNAGGGGGGGGGLFSQTLGEGDWESVSKLIPPPATPTLPTRPSNQISNDTRTVASQTLETAFVPCEACHRVQLSLREVGHLMAGICQSQGVASSLARHMAQYEKEFLLSSADVSRWTSQQGKDLERVNRIFLDLTEKNSRLQQELDSSRERCGELEKRVAQVEKEKQREQQKMNRTKRDNENKLKEIDKLHQTSLLVAERNNQELTSSKRKAEEQIFQMKQQLQSQYETLIELESKNQAISQRLEENSTSKKEVIRLEQHLQSLNIKVAESDGTIDELKKMINKEQAKNRSLKKHEQTLLTKQDALMEQIDHLDQQSKELQQQLEASEETREELKSEVENTKQDIATLQQKFQKEQELYKSVKEEKEMLRSSITDLQTMIVTLETQLSESKEREQLLAQFPSSSVNDITGSGDLAVDMKRQVQANNIRIRILEEQNSTLRNSVSQMIDEQDQGNNSFQAKGPAVALWSQGHEATPPSGGRMRPPSKERDFNRSFSSSRTVSGPSAGTHQSAEKQKQVKVKQQQTHHIPTASNGSLVSSASPSSIGAYVKLKKAGALPSQQTTKNIRDVNREKQTGISRRPREVKQGGWISPVTMPNSQQPYNPVNTFVCDQCDKMYTSKEDLDIHKSYCYG